MRSTRERAKLFMLHDIFIFIRLKVGAVVWRNFDNSQLFPSAQPPKIFNKSFMQRDYQCTPARLFFSIFFLLLALLIIWWWSARTSPRILIDEGENIKSLNPFVWVSATCFHTWTRSVKSADKKDFASMHGLNWATAGKSGAKMVTYSFMRLFGVVLILTADTCIKFA